MKIILIDTAFQKNSLFNLEFVKPIKDILSNLKLKNSTKYDIIEFHYSDLKQNEDFILKSNKIIICGTGLKDNKYIKAINAFNFLKKYNGHIFGICSGAHILSLLYGCQLEKLPEIGVLEASIINNKQENKNINTRMLKKVEFTKIYSLHNYSIKINNKFDILLESENKIPQLLKLKEKEIYLSQFHPEVFNKELIENFINE